ncbi:MAG: hypothetical protein ACFB02_08080 [Mastigocoleus sp.]
MDKLDDFSQKECFALLLSLSELKSEDLNDDERQKLGEIASKLSVVNNSWEFVREDLLCIISNNQVFNTLYQNQLNRINSQIGNNIPPELLPVESEVGGEIYNYDYDENNSNSVSQSQFRGYFEGHPENRDVLTNLCISVLKSPEKAKKISWIQKIKLFFQRK